jgi:hypothetical protein
VLDVLCIVAPVPDVFASAEVSEAKEGLPRNGHHTMSVTDAGELCHRALRRSQVLQNLKARDDTRTASDEWQHSGVGPYAGDRKPLESHCKLVVSILDSDKGAGSYLHRFQSQSLANTDVHPSTGRRTCNLRSFRTKRAINRRTTTLRLLYFASSSPAASSRASGGKPMEPASVAFMVRSYLKADDGSRAMPSQSIASSWYSRRWRNRGNVSGRAIAQASMCCAEPGPCSSAVHPAPGACLRVQHHLHAMVRMWYGLLGGTC